MITLFIVGFVFCFGAVIWLLVDDHADTWWIKWIIFCIGFGGLLGASLYQSKESYNQGQIDALHGTQTFERHLVYLEGDSIPSDTLYLKIDR
jgi:hypothetical protein